MGYRITILTAFLLAMAICTVTTEGLTCNSSNKRCEALVDYKPVNATTLSAIIALFGLETLNPLLGANPLKNFSTNSSNQTIEGGTTVRIPVPCICHNGTGTSNGKPVYKVKAGDNLDSIARQVFSALVTYQEIAAASNISNPSLIQPGQELLIPLPCSCDKVGGSTVVHYAMLVPSGSTVGQIAADFGTTEKTILTLNNMTNPKDLLAGQVLDVPLKVCSSKINSGRSLDKSLLVANGTFAITANNCVKCTCNSPDLQLQCLPSPMAASLNCPAMRCENSNLYLGNVSSTGTCQRTICSYAGYTKSSILTTLVDQTTCPSETPPPRTSVPSNSGFSLQGSIWKRLFMLMNLGLICVCILC